MDGTLCAACANAANAYNRLKDASGIPAFEKSAGMARALAKAFNKLDCEKPMQCVAVNDALFGKPEQGGLF